MEVEDMRIIEIAAQSNGAHRNQSGVDVLPNGWSIIPDDMALDNFPFGEIEVEEIEGIQTVTGWTPGVMPDPEPEPERTPSLSERVAALETDAANDRAALMLLLTGEETEATT